MVVAGRLQPARALHPAEQLIRGSRFDEALALLAPLREAHPDDGKLIRLTHLALMGQRRFDAAIDMIGSACAVQPDNLHYRALRAIALKDAGQFAEALAVLDSLVVDEDPALLGALCVVHHRLGNKAAALGFGQRKLDLLDRLHSGDKGVGPISADAGETNVVSFSLWGSAEQYVRGALTNAAEVPIALPGWRARFYVGRDVPAEVCDELTALGAELVHGQHVVPNIPPPMWRFLVHDDAAVDRYLVRDCDSRIGAREVSAVDGWLNGGRGFHVMRDHVFHHDLILAGMWGGTARCAFAMAAEAEAFFEARGPESRYGVDQIFLAERIWPLVRDNLVSHDSHYQLAGSLAFPDGGRGDDDDHIGMGLLL